MKAIEQIDSKKLRGAVKALNEHPEILTEKVRAVGVSKVDMAKAFVDAIDNLDDAVKARVTAELPDVAAFYNDLIIDEIEASEAPGVEVSVPAEETCECPEPAPSVPEPTPATVAEAAEQKKGRGRRAAPAPAPAATEQAKPAATPAPAKPDFSEPATVAAAATKAEPKKTIFGHKEGSLAAFMDELLIKGTTIEAGAEAIVAEKGKTKERGIGALKEHIPYLRKLGFSIVKDETTGVFKLPAKPSYKK